MIGQQEILQTGSADEGQQTFGPVLVKIETIQSVSQSVASCLESFAIYKSITLLY